VSAGHGNGGGHRGGDPNGVPGKGSGAAGSEPKRPLGTVVASAVEAARSLARKHVELAKIEAAEAASVRAAGAGMMGAAGALAMLAFAFVAAAGAAALALVMPVWAAILIVAVMLLAVAGVLVLIGRRSIRTAPGVERTKELLKEDARWARQQIAR
jgi:uncharacterized membrane protein